MRFAVQTWGTDLDAVKAYARDAEAMGYDALWYGDGLWPWTHEGWTVLAALATLTTRIRLGPAVTYILDTAYRHRSLLAQLATSLDWLSGGRLDLRLGLGASAPEAATRAEKPSRSWVGPECRPLLGRKVFRGLPTERARDLERLHLP